ncbi:hypothetical protein HUT19_22760 [Streptomyces sp. NA02950]|uniref:hypothetical protein n=1 Tax=Streptomyces sp. NA02950 TaxID=2742137 RepID=UPI00159182E2|nr:hypothetical protein [Streptomyces sp. NA02950]QKV94231.1 hypothetical protein HUT19_22760 [Streptomyces sp. NA02950]
MTAGQESAVHPDQPTAWARFLGHAEGCADCRDSQRCMAGNELHDAVRREARAAAP